MTPLPLFYNLIFERQKAGRAMADSPGKWITVREAIAYLGLSERTIRRRIKAGELTTKESKKGVLIYLGDTHTGKRFTDATGTPQAAPQARPQAYIQQLQAEIADLREQAERWEQTADRLAQEGQELWGKLADREAEAREWQAIANERQRAIERLEEDKKTAWAALATALAKIPSIEARASEPDRPRQWWQFWK